MIKEEWSWVREFPRYAVSNHGRVYSERLDRVVATSRTQYGHVKIAFFDEALGQRFTRSVSLLVGEAFVERPDRHCDHIIILNGDLQNVAAWNLGWRPRGFAWSYFHQLHQHQPLYFRNLKIQNVTTGFEYQSVVEAGMAEGLLFQDVWRSTYTGARIYPYGCVYRVNQRV